MLNIKVLVRTVLLKKGVAKQTISIVGWLGEKKLNQAINRLLQTKLGPDEALVIKAVPIVPRLFYGPANQPICLLITQERLARLRQINPGKDPVCLLTEWIVWSLANHRSTLNYLIAAAKGSVWVQVLTRKAALLG